MIEIVMVPEIGGLPPEHPAYEQAHAELQADIADAGLPSRERTVPAAGRKGGLTEYAALPGSSAAAWAAFQVIRLWIARDRSRKITVTLRRPGTDPLTVEVSGDRISLDLMESSLRKVLDDQLPETPAAPEPRE